MRQKVFDNFKWFKGYVGDKKGSSCNKMEKCSLSECDNIKVFLMPYHRATIQAVTGASYRFWL